ncbi:hypothetical protein [Brevibacillus panacihumi]|uniref:hypothetical protein n=1 Tax=Brevibacillus panacihumi TaxID=497735 RepID=UPI003D2149BB
MSFEAIHEKVTDLCISGILRCLRSSTTIGKNLTNNFSLSNMNLEMLRYYWALSSGVEEIANVVVHNSRRLTTAITHEEFERVGEITGSINAGATMLAQARTLNPTLFVVLEPNITSHSEPNHLVAWTLSEAFHILLSARRLYKQLGKYDWFNKKISILEQALRNEMLHEILLTSSGRKRPNGSVLRAASKARVPVYQKAIELYDLLEGIERGLEEAIFSCLSQTLIANLEYWQRLELATAIQAANALSLLTDTPVNFSFPFTSGRPIASVGRFKIYWQFTIPQRSREQLDLTELWSRQIATGIGIKSSDSRADVAVCYDEKVVSLFECKYFESTGSLPQAVLDASSQIVRYARDLHPDSIPHAKILLSESCIVVANRGSLRENLDPLEPINQTFDKRFIYFTDINGLLNNSLQHWSKQLSNRYSVSSEVLDG